jgi:hypothetical protein
MEPLPAFAVLLFSTVPQLGLETGVPRRFRDRQCQDAEHGVSSTSFCFLQKPHTSCGRLQSSFLNRAWSSSKDGAGTVTTANAGSGTGRYYIFGRDDSNSGMGFDIKEQGDKESEKVSCVYFNQLSAIIFNAGSGTGR